MRMLTLSRLRGPRASRLLLAALIALLGASLLTLANVPRALACPVCVPPDRITLSGDGVSDTDAFTITMDLGWRRR